jgi:hypothetical protein
MTTNRVSKGAGDNRLPALAAEIRKAHADVQEAAKTAAERAIEAGHALIEAKELVRHGEWLPWLRENCALAERTAQLYMRIAKLGLDSATVADLGLNATAKTITLQYPDPFADDPEDVLEEWRLFALHLMKLGFWSGHATQMCEWYRRNGWNSPSEWHGADGDRYRKSWGMRPMPEKTKAQWAAFLAENQGRPKKDIDDKVRHIMATEPPEPLPTPAKRRRRRRTA